MSKGDRSAIADIIRKAKEPESQQTSNLENQKTRKKASKQTNKPTKADDIDVNLSVKVGLSRRQHWAAEAKRQGTTLTAEIISALSQRFGEPQ